MRRFVVVLAAGIALGGCGDEEEPAPEQPSAERGGLSVDRRDEFATSKAVCEQEGLEAIAKRAGVNSRNPAEVALAYVESGAFIVPDEVNLQEAAYRGCLAGLSP